MAKPTSSMQKAKANGKAPPPSLAEFVHTKRVQERKETCVLCRLPLEVRDEIKVARKRKTSRDDIIEWLGLLKYKVSDLDFQTHNAGLHEQREEAQT